MVTESEKRLVQESFAAIAPIGDDAAALFGNGCAIWERKHVKWRATPADYLLVAREALLTALRAHSPVWSDAIAHDWKSAVTAIIVAMLEGCSGRDRGGG